MEKKVIELGFYDSGTGKHQSNTVYFSKGMMPTMTTIGGGTYQIKVLRKVDMNNQDDIILGTNERTNEIIILGAIGNTDRQNRDNMRVLSAKGLVQALKSHISKEPPMVVRKPK